MAEEANTSSFAQFAEALSQSRDQPVSSLLDAADGLALSFADTCNARAINAFEEVGTVGLGKLLNKKVQYGTNGELLPTNGFLELYEEDEADDALAWRLEEQTWRLIHFLHAERVQRSQEQKMASTSRDDPYRTPFAAVQDILESDAALSELKIVRDWLSNNLSNIHSVEVRKGYWPFTKNRVRNEKRLGGTSTTTSSLTPAKGRSSTFGTRSAFSNTNGSKGVKSLDPDATTREGSTLELEDAAYEKALNKTLFEYTRGGQLDNAIDLARQTDRSWRAASLRGANLYWRSGLDDDMDDEIATPLGNRNRALWKAVCRSLCAKSSIDEYERALYGALSGDLKSVLNVSTTWDAQLWAYANARFETAIDARLDRLGNWWGQGAADTFGLSSTSKELGSVQLQELRITGSNATLIGSNEQDAPLAVELRDVFVKLGQSEQNGIHTQGNHPFRIVQRAVILSELPALLTHVESLLASMRVTVSPQQYARLTRFFAHLILYLRLIKWDNMPNDIVCNSILKAYVDVLENVGEADLVALYASSLEPESATESYAHYLKLMDPNERMEVKQMALLRAEKNDLDVAAVAVMVVSMIFDEALPALIPTMNLTKTSLDDLNVELKPLEERLIRSIDWLCIHESTHIDAIIHANVLIRVFLNNGCLNAARTLLFNLPSEVVEKVGLLEEEGDQDSQASEFVHWRTFFDALDRHLRFVEIWSRKPSEKTSSRIDRLNWTKALNAVVDEAKSVILQILQMDWIKFNVESMDIQTERRLTELTQIRRVYIPELIFRLHLMMFETHSVLAQNLAFVIQLPNLVADERHKLYLDFISGEENRLKEYLNLVRIAEMASLEQNPDPFYLASNTQDAIGLLS